MSSLDEVYVTKKSSWELLVMDFILISSRDILDMSL